MEKWGQDIMLRDKEDGKSLMDWNEITSKSPIWGAGFIVASAIPVASALCSEATGFMAWTSRILTPLFTDVPVWLVYTIIVFTALILTNLASNWLTTEEKRYWLTKDLDKFLMMNILVKHWPANMWIQTPIELVHDMKMEFGLKPEDIQEIIIDPPTQLRMHFYEEGFSSLMEAQFSMPFCIAIMLYGDKPGAQWFERERYTDPKIFALARKVKAGPSPEDTLQGSFVQFQNGTYPMKTVTIVMKDGTVHRRSMDKHKGHPDNMLTREEFCRLFMDNAVNVLSEEKAERLMNFILDIENRNDMSEMFDCFA